MSTTAPTEAPVADHTWALLDDEFEDGGHVRRFECAVCGAVRFE